MVSAKREPSKEEVLEPEAKWAKVDCDLDFDIEDNGLKGSAIHQEGFAYCWSGARANISVKKFIRPLASIGFSKNGKLLGTAKHFDAVLKMSLLLPKGMSLGNQLLGISLKRYVLLGTNVILDRMKVHGLLRKQNYGERFELLIGRLSVVVFPKPEELKIRSNKISKEMGKEVAADAVNNMLAANYVFPVMFVELDRGEAQGHLDEMKRALAFTEKSRSFIRYFVLSLLSLRLGIGKAIKNLQYREDGFLVELVCLTRGRIDPYQSYRVVDPYSRPGSVVDPYRPSMVESPPMGSARASPFTKRNISGQFSPIACPQSYLWATGPQDHPQFCLVLALPCSPYGTPMVRPSNGNFPANSRIREEMPPFTPGNY
ncbi:hypothetical protein EZV62_026580 [Acer yangbiense]|uniref:Uncharacterized protein n=1 Tax=Acer yangbiense TaxID=1000413 RepID=A0A5C7GT29_9ROSI|nr:hypothetical protein EZV62_026580 [Acer yangbiense]